MPSIPQLPSIPSLDGVLKTPLDLLENNGVKDTLTNVEGVGKEIFNNITSRLLGNIKGVGKEIQNSVERILTTLTNVREVGDTIENRRKGIINSIRFVLNLTSKT